MEKLQQLISQTIEKETEKLFQKKIKIKREDIITPPNIDWGDFAYPCFGLAKELRTDPKRIAGKLADAVKEDKAVKSAQARGAYLNFLIKKEFQNKLIIESILLKKQKAKKQKQKIMIEYSSPNPCKTFHVGHLRNTVLGSSLIHLYKEKGYSVISANYLNDTGIHVAKVIWLYQKKYQGKEPKDNKGKWLGDLYVKANTLIEKNKNYKQEVSDIHKKVENGDKKITALLNRFKKWSQTEFDRIYSQLNAQFDEYFYDSDYIHSGKAIVNGLLKKGVAEKSRGAVIVDLEKYGLHTLVVLKSDGTAVYITKDFAMAKDRFEKFKVDKLIYVVGSEQSLHFKQLFKILELYGFKQAKNCVHLPYELVRLTSGKISSRAGGAPLYSDIYENGFKLALAETKKRHKTWPQKKLHDTASKITLAALKFTMLKYDTNKVIVFDIKKSLAITGDTGPYILYTLARIHSILDRTGSKKPSKIDYSLINTPEEKEIIHCLGQYKNEIDEALALNKPSVLANYILELSHTFNHFYHIHSIIKSDTNQMSARIMLVLAVKEVFEKCLSLLNIDTLKEM